MFQTSSQPHPEPERSVANDAAVRHHFVVRAEREPSVLARVLELFSILSVVPEGVRSGRAGDDDCELRIDVLAEGLSQQKAQYLQLRIDQFPCVRSVLVEKEVMLASELDYREAVYQMRISTRKPA